jgi:hypothetical protein
MRKADINFWTDVTIGVAFTLSAASGVVFLLPLSGESALGIGFQTWNTVHTWSSLLAVGGVIAHLALHWRWVVQMTRRNIAARLGMDGIAGPPAQAGVVGRRAFLRYAALGALFTGATVVTARVLRDGESAAASAASTDEDAKYSTGAGLAASAASTSSRTQSSGRLSVACRKGVTYCPYPGRCHSFRDRDRDGYCDLSIPS